MGQVPGGVQLQLFLTKPTLAAASNGTVTAGEPITGHVDAGPASVVAPNSKVRITVLNQQPGQTSARRTASPWKCRWTRRETGVPRTVVGRALQVLGGNRERLQPLRRRRPVRRRLPASRLRPSPHRWTASRTARDSPPSKPSRAPEKPARTVRLSGDFTGTGLVDADGRWSINVADQPVFGKISVTAVLTAPGEMDSPAATSTYTVIPPAPAVSNLRDGKHLRQDALPSDHLRHRPSRCRRGRGGGRGGRRTPCRPVPVSGAGSAALEPGTAQTLAGSARWSVPFPAGLAAGAHTLDRDANR